jgi:hypothetical protein
MKHILAILLLLPVLSGAQTKSVLKNINGNTLTESLVVPSGTSLTIASGATINAAVGSTITGFSAGGVTSITGTANEITVTGTTTPTLSLPSALTFTGKTITGGTFNSATLTGYLTSATAASTYATIASLGGAAFLDASADATADAVARYDDAGRLRSTSINFKDSGFEAALRADSLTASVGYLLPSQSEDGLRLLTTGGSAASLTNFPTLNQNTTGYASALKSASTTVDVAAATAPTSGQVLTATGSTAATWQTISSGITIGTTTSNGTAGRILYTDGTNVQAYPVTGTGSVAMSASTAATVTTLGTNSVTPVTALTLENTTAATVGLQSASPALVLSSKGWKTTATAASQKFDWRVYSLPIQGSTAPDGSLVFGSAVNNGAYTDAMHLYPIGNVKNLGLGFAGAYTISPSLSSQATYLYHAGNSFSLTWSSSTRQVMNNSGDYLTSTGGMFGWSGLKAGYESADVFQINNGTLNTRRDLSLRNIIHTDYIEGTEMTAPAAPAANKGRLYFEDNGSGKTRLMVIFPSGAAQQIAIEP